MSLDDLRGRPVAWCVEVSGLSTRYYSHVPPGTGLHSGEVGTTGEVYVDVHAILDGGVSAHGGRIDEVGGVAKHDPVTVKLLGRGAGGSDGLTVHPYLELLRSGHRGASRWAKLLTTLPHGFFSGVDVEVDRDVSGWTVPGFIHLGQECIHVTGTDGTGAPGDPYRFTGCDRASHYTQPQHHVVDALRGEDVYVTQEPVFWRGRRSRVYVAPLYQDGTAGTWVEYWRGFIGADPTMRGDVITLEIAPLTAALDWQVGIGASRTTTTTVAGWHYMTAGVLDTLRATVVWKAGDFFRQAVTGADVGLQTVDVFTHADVINDACDATLPPNNPHHGIFRLASPETEAQPMVSVAVGLGTSGTVEFPDATIPTAVVGVYSVLESAPAEEFYDLPLVDEDAGTSALLRWPTALWDAIRRADAWRVARGGVASWTDPSSEGGPLMWTSLGLQMVDGTWHLTARKRFHSPGDPWVGVDLAHDRGCSVGSGLTYGPGELATARAAVGWQPRRALRWMFQAEADHDKEPTRLPVLGPPDWYYQPGEPYVGPLADDLYTGSGEAQTLRFSGWGGSVDIAVTGSTAVTDEDGNTVGYVYDVAEPLKPSLGCLIQMPGDAPLSATMVVQARSVALGEFVRRLLVSGVGEGQNGPADVLPMGLNFAQAEVDEASFDVDAPGALSDQTWEVDPGKPVSEQLRPLLLVLGAQVCQVYDGQNWVLRLVPLGPPSSTDASATIADADCTGRPETLRDGRVVRSYRIKVNHPRPGEDGEPVEVPYVDQAARNAGGGDTGETLDLDLRGVRIAGGAGDLASAMHDIIAGLRERLGSTRSRWRVRLTSDLVEGLSLGIGDTVAFTSEWAVDVIPSRSVAARPCRVVGIKRDLLRGTLELELAAHHGVGAGYVPAMRVDSVTDADTLDVELGAFSDDDVGYFQEGDAVALVPAGDFASKTYGVITTIAGQTLTITGHGMVAGDTIRFARHDLAIAARDFVGGYAFIADAAELLSDGSAGKVIG